MTKPLIGITGRALRFDTISGSDERFGREHVHVAFSAFSARVCEAGGIGVNIPFEAPPEDTVHRLDGLIVTGGQDVHPSRWGGTAVVDPATDPRRDYTAHDRERDSYEEALIRAALTTATPLLAVCRGVQLLNVVRGGTLVEHITETVVRHDSHVHAPFAGDDDHCLTFTPGSVLCDVYGSRRITNSWHHQCLDRLGAGLVATAHADDGVVEAVELPGLPVIGVQWHPEWTGTPDPIFDWLVEAATPWPAHPTPNELEHSRD